MRLQVKHSLGVLIALILVLPVWAGSSSSRKDSTAFDTFQITMLGKTQLQPGHYTLEATESTNQLDVVRDGETIATVPCQWVQLPKKAMRSEILSDNNRVNEVLFEGRTEAVKVG